MDRRGFVGGIAALFGAGAANAEAEKKEPSHFYGWGAGDRRTTDPRYVKEWPIYSDRAVLTCDGKKLKMVTKAVTGPNGWAEVLEVGPDGKCVVDWGKFEAIRHVIYGDVRFVVFAAAKEGQQPPTQWDPINNPGKVVALSGGMHCGPAKEWME
jgi:hypothetical protein